MRLQLPISMAIMDLDYFKALNDNYGHQFGDECLIRVAAAMNEFTNRPDDICARYGGDEFALIWGNTPGKAARTFAAALKKKITSLEIENDKSSSKYFLTVSIGVAEMFPSRGSEESELIAKADRALYKAKDGGRNRIEV